MISLTLMLEGLIKFYSFSELAYEYFYGTSTHETTTEKLLEKNLEETIKLHEEIKTLEHIIETNDIKLNIE